jgi:hypothetical protein
MLPSHAMLRHPPRRRSALILGLALACRAAHAQVIGDAPLVRPALERDELSRVNALLDSAGKPYSTLRAPSRQLAWPVGVTSFTVFSPEITVGNNSALPYGFNDGPLWQGRGINVQAIIGMAVTVGPVRVIVAPEFLSSANLAYQTVPYPQNGPGNRAVWANPFHPAPNGIDLPSRFGNQPLRSIDWGQSSVTLRLPAVELGVSTENVWWGPGMQNALVWSSQAAGVPSAFVRTRAPVKTAAGTFDAWYNVGTLKESNFFDRNPNNNLRSMAAIAANWRPPNTTGLEFGLARMVIADGGVNLGTLFDAFRSVGQPNSADTLSPGTHDQITSLWTRWAPPGVGFEAWAEWARFEEPTSLRDLLVNPGHSEGYTVGLQWARRVGNGTVRFWGEGTYLEPSPSLRTRPEGVTYVSRSVPQGFTELGQMLGAGIGPGASSQWIGGDWLHSRWRVGAYLARVRWDNAAVYGDSVPQPAQSDISLISGLRLAGEWARIRILLDWAHSVRLNYLYQTYHANYTAGTYGGIDIANDALNVTLSVPWQRRKN